jgi:hypothetical protein
LAKAQTSQLYVVFFKEKLPVEPNKFFIFINRFNSIISILLLLVAGVSFVYINTQSNNWGNRRAVTLKESPESNQNIKLVLGKINTISGSSVLYVNLSENDNNFSYKSGSSAVGIRNTLFFKDKEIKPNWLFESNEYLIQKMDQLKIEDHNEKNPAISFIYEVVYKDTNDNKRLDSKDKVTIALSNLDGSIFKNVVQLVDSLIDHQVSSDGKEVALIYQINQKVILERISLENFQSISKSEITQVEKT